MSKYSRFYFLAYLILVIVNFGHLAFATTKFDQINLYVKKLTFDIESQYNRLASDKSDFNGRIQAPYFQRPQGVDDSDEVTYLLHGFMGAPYEMSFLAAESLAMRVPVFNDLILGYGADAQISNQIQFTQWKKWQEKNLIYLLSQFKKVNLVGFSTGGLLLSYFIKDHPEYLHLIKSVTLVSPFYFPHHQFYASAGKLLNLVTTKVNVNFFYQTTHYPDVKVMVAEPNYYLSEVPIESALGVVKLAEDFVNNHLEPTHYKFPIHFHFSQNDKVLDLEKSQGLIRSLFPGSQISIYSQGNSPHHLMVPAVSDHVAQIRKSLRGLIQAD